MVYGNRANSFFPSKKRIDGIFFVTRRVLMLQESTFTTQ